MTKSEVDRLGMRLKRGDVLEADLRLLDAYRRSFAEAYETVIRALDNSLKLRPTGRPAKSTTSIVEKLRRESIRLTQMQDIAGCRIIVRSLALQDRLMQRLPRVFDNVVIIDRRSRPSHGYRASLQHLWAEWSEKLSDVVDPAIKYGGGDEEVRGLLRESSELVVEHEKYDMDLARLVKRASRLKDAPPNIKQGIVDLRRDHDARRRAIARLFRQFISDLAPPAGRA